MHGRDEDKCLKTCATDTKSPFAEPVVLPLEDFIDLHPFHPKDIPSVVEEYLEQCSQAGLKEIRIIHGRGTGVQRNIVQNILQRHPLVLSFRDAPPETGGWGAAFVLLNISKTLKDK
jgi:DNA-nicking Smr family endonuclease